MDIFRQMFFKLMDEWGPSLGNWELEINILY